ncbi:SNF5-domain-containing protein [Hymenopellis radicata]|nr:SNF5-domain-containing protein [Hymenopellis radicata]
MDGSVFQNMTDAQLGQTISQLSAVYGPVPTTNKDKTYMKNLQNWTTTTPVPKNAAISAPVVRLQSQAPLLYPPPPPQVPQGPLPTVPQGYLSTYASRLRTGATLLMQPVIQPATTSNTMTRAATRRGGGVVSYADIASGDEEGDSDDSDFVGEGRDSAKPSFTNRREGVFVNASPRPTPPPPPPQDDVLTQSYLGQVPPNHFIRARNLPHAPPFCSPAYPLPLPNAMPMHGVKPSLVPIRVEFETDTLRVRDCFVWNMHESAITPEAFARTFCNDVDLPIVPWVETIAAQIRAQLEEAVDYSMFETEEEYEERREGECRVILSIDVQIGTYHLSDHIEWDLLSPLTPEAFTTQLCGELGLSGEAHPLIAHAIHEELTRHKKDAVEWGVLGPSSEKDRAGVMKDRTGLGGWSDGRARAASFEERVARLGRR